VRAVLKLAAVSLGAAVRIRGTFVGLAIRLVVAVDALGAVLLHGHVFVALILPDLDHGRGVAVGPAEDGRAVANLGRRIGAFAVKQVSQGSAGIPAEEPYLASYRKRAVCGDWMAGAPGLELGTRRPVCTENLNAGVAVMKSAQDGA
jgi:hypothetical protein